jgi:hypothetical protein
MNARSALALLIAATQFTGCATAIGTSVGAAVDEAGRTRFSLMRLDRLEEGQVIDVRLRSGARISGAYEGQHLSTDEYLERYAAARETSDLPALGEPVAAHVGGGSLLKGELLGFDPDHLVLRRDDGPQRAVALRDLEALAVSSGRHISGRRIQVLADSGRVPFRYRLAVAAQTIRLEDVRSIERPRTNPHAGMTTGAILGFVLDVAIAVTLSNMEFQ